MLTHKSIIQIQKMIYLFIDSKIDSLVDTNEFLEFVDTLDDGEQTGAIEPKSVTESQFSSVMSYHEGDSTPLMDPRYR